MFEAVHADHIGKFHENSNKSLVLSIVKEIEI